MSSWVFIGFCLSLFLSVSAKAALQLPTQLTRQDREEVTRIIGFGTSNKILSDPYPLGGYSGFEAGISVETMSVEDLSQLGSKNSNPQQDLSYPKLTIGKGLYSDIDVFLDFMPYTQAQDLSLFGAMFRWGVYQATFLPLSLSILAHANITNINNQLTTRTMGVDLIGGLNVENVALFFGGGPLQSHGQFVPSLTDSGAAEAETVSGYHTVIGASVQVSYFFLVMQIDRYNSPVYSGKLGMRF